MTAKDAPRRMGITHAPHNWARPFTEPPRLLWLGSQLDPDWVFPPLNKSRGPSMAFRLSQPSETPLFLGPILLHTGLRHVQRPFPRLASFSTFRQAPYHLVRDRDSLGQKAFRDLLGGSSDFSTIGDSSSGPGTKTTHSSPALYLPRSSPSGVRDCAIPVFLGPAPLAEGVKGRFSLHILPAGLWR